MGYGGRERGRLYILLYISLYCHHQNDSCIRMGNDDNMQDCPIQYIQSSFFTCHSVSMRGRCHVWPRLNEFSGVVVSSVTLSRSTDSTDVVAEFLLLNVHGSEKAY